MITFRVLGPQQVRINGVDCTPRAAKVRQVLALTLLNANQVVTIETMIEELWGDRPPRSAVTTTQTYIYQIRKMVSEHAGLQVAANTVRTMPRGYLLQVEDDQLDWRRFERMVQRAESLFVQGQHQSASQLLSEALALWNGSALADIRCGSLLQGYVARLEEKRIAALERRLKADMCLGRHRELIPELRSLVNQHPYNEWLHGQLVFALYRSGRRGEALGHFHNARRLLNEELGLDPSPDLEEIHRLVLNAEVVSG